VKDLLFSEGYRFSFFQAVRLLERLSPGKEPVGYAVDPRTEVVRFRSRVSLGFPPSEIHEITEDVALDRPPEMTVGFFGLVGPVGPLPHAYTELLIERARYKDTALWSFLDLFHHRLLSLFYRAWEKYRFPIAYERTGEDPFTLYLFDVVGMGTKGLRGRMEVQDQALLYYAGLVAQRPRSAVAIAAILRDYFGVPAEVVQFHGQWLPLEQENLSRVGSANSDLGRNVVAGTHIFVSQSKFRVRLGPLTLAQFGWFLPVGRALRPLAQLTRLLAGMELDFDVQLVLKREEVPFCKLSSGAVIPPMLGWTTWVRTEEMQQDAGDVVLTVDNELKVREKR
jgi:type VI secretion system protein ImpH